MGILTAILKPADKLLYKSQKAKYPLAVKDSGPHIFPSLFEHHPDAIFTIDSEGNFISCNHSIETFIGYRPNQMIGSFTQYVKQEDLDKVMNHFQLALKGIPQNYNCEVIHKSGSFVHLNITNIPLEVNGEIMGVYGFAKDLSDLHEKEEELVNKTNSLILAEEIAMLGSWDYDLENDYVYCSDQLYQILGIENKESMIPTYQNLLNLIYSEDRVIFDYHFQRTKKTGITMDLVYRLRKQDNTLVTVHTRAEAEMDANGRVIRLIGILQDISDQVLTETKLKESEEKFKTIARNLDVGIWSLDIRSKQIVYASPGLEKITGFANENFLSGEKSWNELIHPDDIERFLALQPNLARGKMNHHQYRIITATGETKWMEDKTFPTLDSDGKLIRLDGIVQDISERRLGEERINFFAYHDYLTELPNRRMFEDELEKMISAFKGNNKLALMYIDLDRFKFVNDTLGHAIGDELLRQVSKRLSLLVVGQGSLFRNGGDEFSIILNEISDSKDPVALGQAIIKEIEKPFSIEGYEMKITASVGIGIFPEDGKTIKELKMNTDAALYRAKELGKNNVQVFTRSLNIESYKLFMLETDLRKAILKEQFTLHYQPRVNTFTGEIVGAEALIRWNHPKWGLVSPAEFIPLAEESELINEIGEWVFKQVCIQLYKWTTTEGCNPVPISINLSAKTFLKADLVPIFQNYLVQYNIPSSLLEIEITEDSIIKNEATVLNTLKLFKELGISISLDDFGTGFSSIGYLKKFNADYIKIDRSFIKDMLENDGDYAIVNSIILLAKGFQLKVVAEGVETEEQRKALEDLNCTYSQGYLFSKPLAVEQFEKLLYKDEAIIEPVKNDITLPMKDKRMFYRIVFSDPIIASMTITKIKGEKIAIGSTDVSLLNIGEGGLSFSSKLHLPVTEELTLKFEIMLFDEPIIINGHVVWKQERKNNEFHYGLEFSLMSREKNNLKSKLLVFENEKATLIS
jgi:diguanylate cyclase (GGDEF)-like protein/PAS domain S-box-containing protein